MKSAASLTRLCYTAVCRRDLPLCASLAAGRWHDRRRQSRSCGTRAVTAVHYPPWADNAADADIGALVRRYASLAAGEKKRHVSVTVAGRVVAKRDMGKLIFYKVSRQSGRIQIMCDAKLHGQDTPYHEHHGNMRVGDIAQFAGFVGKSQKGELSVVCERSRLLAPCMNAFVKDGAPGVADRDLRQRRRYLDLLSNAESRRRFALRSAVTARLRHCLAAAGYTEVETPTLCSLRGGATARPFVTAAALLAGAQLALRVAPELYLKMLLVGGMERVFELGRVFRNEGLARWHNPEFTMCELYAAYADCAHMMRITEQLFADVAACLERDDGDVLEYQGVRCKISRPFQTIPFYDSLQECLGEREKLPPVEELHTDAARDYLEQIVESLHITMTGARTAPRLLDKLWSTLVPGTMCTDATFVTDHPAVMSPLAKRRAGRHAALSERFELFVAGAELANGYTEQNDPRMQAAAFDAQRADAAMGDDESPPGDTAEFIAALQYGMPPAAGCGVGVDRLCMLLADAPTLKDVILFPMTRPQHDGHKGDGDPVADGVTGVAAMSSY